MMPLSRRRFLSMTAAVPLALPQRLAGEGWTVPVDSAAPRCLLVDAGQGCVLQESLAGFVCGLVAASIPFERVCAEGLRLRPARLVIVPGAVISSPVVAATMYRLIDRGSTVLYESGAAYADRGTFEIERRLLRTHFGLSVEAPEELWPSKPETGHPSYVHYHWPSGMMIRDFSRMITVAGSTSDFTPIARIGEAVVACRHAAGRGAFIFLGSPLGPHLGYGDPEAHRLLEAFASSARTA